MSIKFTKRIYGYECDIYGHLNNANYLPILEAARSEALTLIGIPITKLLAAEWHVYIRKVEMEFLKAVLLEDIIEVRSNVVELNRLRSRWEQQIFNSTGELCFTASIHVVHAKNGKPARVPDEIYDYFLRFTEFSE